MNKTRLHFIFIQCKKKLLPLFLLTFTSGLISCGGTDTGADPGVEDFPIAFVKRSILVDDNGNIIQPDIRRPLRSTPGGDIFLKKRASISSPAVNITQSITNGLGDVKDLDVSSDGKLLIFSLKEEDPNPNDNDEPKWNIYIYDLEEGGEPTRVISSDLIANEGDDIAPYFLPNNNRIVFSSNRQKKSRAILLDEALSKPQFSSRDEDNQGKALVLHVMDLDGSNIKQISFNQSHDLDPVVLSNGRILFSRWDNMNRNDAVSLYTLLQDGSDLQPYYGTHDQSHDITDNTLQFIQPRELPNGQIMALQLPYSGSFGGGEIITIDGTNYVDLNQPTTSNIGALSGPATQKVTASNLAFDGSIAIEGRYSSFYPLNDGTSRILVSKGLCQVEFDTGTDPTTPNLETFLCVDANAAEYLASDAPTEAYPSYGLWLLDTAEQTEKPIERAEIGKFLSDAVVMRPYDRATIELGKTTLISDSDPLVIENVGLLNIRSVYDFGIGDGILPDNFFGTPLPANAQNLLSLGDPAVVPVDQNPARFIRIVKAVGIPIRNDPDLADPPNLSNLAFGRGSLRLGMKEIIGYAPIQPDGSVLVKVPADVAFYIEVLDKFARRISPRHENWLQVAAGETLACNGCHSHRTDTLTSLPHGRIDAEAASLNTGAASDGFTYPNTENPSTSAPYFANLGDTMAEVLSRSRQEPAATLDVNVRYSDVWTDPANTNLTPGSTLNFLYSDLTTTNIPTTAACETQWESTCRIVINYQEHIQPLWEIARVRLDPNTNLPPVVDPITNLPVLEDVTCTNCHNTVDIANADAPMVPAGQLDLTSGQSDEQARHIESYRELFFNDNGQVLNGGALEDATISVPDLDENGVQIIDGNGNPQFNDIPDPSKRVPASMNSTSARISFFMEKMTETELSASRVLPTTPTVNHANMLTPAELRLISEFLDIGGQYFNNPFDPAAPQN